MFSDFRRFDRNPKYRIFINPIGIECSKNRLMNSNHSFYKNTKNILTKSFTRFTNWKQFSHISFLNA